MEQGLSITEDGLLGGRLRIKQYDKAYRIAIDPVFLAAAIPAMKGERVLDLGCGVGAASLCLAHRVPSISIIGIEKEPLFVRLAQENVQVNHLQASIDIRQGDVSDLPADVAGFDWVMANPPYLAAGAASPSPFRLKAIANIEDEAGLEQWIVAAAKACRSKSGIVFIHRWDRRNEFFSLMGGLGQVRMIPLIPADGKEAKRGIYALYKDRQGESVTLPSFVLHQADGTYTPQADDILRYGGALVGLDRLDHG